jgi:hypothetical protein
MSDESKLEHISEENTSEDSHIENCEPAGTTLSEIPETQSPEPSGLMVFFVTSSQTRLPSRYRRRRRRAGTRLAHMRRRELRYTGPSFGDMGR